MRDLAWVLGRSRRLRFAGVALLTLAVSTAHYLTPPSHLLWHNVYQRLYYIPLLLACAWFGLRGGLITAAGCIVLYSPHIMLHWAHMRAYQANQLMELTMLGLIGVVAGFLSDRQRTLRKQAEALAAERDRALQNLQETVDSLRQADRLATLGTLAAGLAHEIRNPLGAMGGALEILESEYPKDHSHREFIDILKQEVGRLSRVVGKYLDYARPQAPEPRPVDANAVVRSAVDLLKRSAARASTRFECHLQEKLPPALADPVQIHQAMVNLLLNAIQAMPSGGVVEVDTAAAPDLIKITVTDHGKGLPDGPTERLFEPFFSTKTAGTGLGLAVARQIALSHGGRISAENAERGGAMFCLELPVASAEEVP